MATVTLRYFLFLFAACCVLASTSLSATTVDFSAQSPYFRDSAGNWHNSKNFNSQLSAGKLTYEGQFRVQSPSTGRSVPVPVTRTVEPAISRVGGVVKALAKSLGPVAVGVAIYDLVCSTTSICNDGNDGWEASSQIPNVGENTTGDLVGDFQSPVNPFPVFGNLSGAENHVCETGFSGSSHDHTTRLSDNGPNQRYQVFCSFGSPFSAGVVTAPSSSVNPDTHPATDQDWDDAEASMNDIDFVEPLMDGQHDIPIETPDSFPPVNTIVSEKTTQLKDANGNVTGSQVETTTLTLTDSSSESSPNLIDVKETKTTTNYDIDNNITDQSTTVIEGQPTEQPAEDDITFDDVSDTELEEKEVSAILETTSWGGGSCPAPIAMDTTFGSYQFDTQPFCDYSEALKPFILIVASIIAGLIILRSRQT